MFGPFQCLEVTFKSSEWTKNIIRTKLLVKLLNWMLFPKNHNHSSRGKSCPGISYNCRFSSGFVNPTVVQYDFITKHLGRSSDKFRVLWRFSVALFSECTGLNWSGKFLTKYQWVGRNSVWFRDEWGIICWP